MSKTFMDMLATSRIRPKMVAYFANNDSPIGTRKLARIIGEDAGAVGHLVREYRIRGFITKTETGYILAATNLREEFKRLADNPS